MCILCEEELGILEHLIKNCKNLESVREKVKFFF